MALTETLDPSDGLSQIFERDSIMGSDNLKSPKINYIQEVRLQWRERVHKRDLLNAEFTKNLERVRHASDPIEICFSFDNWFQLAFTAS